MFQNLHRLSLLVVTVIFAHTANAQGLPRSVAQENFEALKSQSPFTRVLNFADTYSLRGVAVIGNEAVARLYDRNTKKTLTVTETEANRLGMTLVGVTNDPVNLEGVSVRIAFGDEEVDIHYNSAQIAPQPKPTVVYKKDSRGNPIPPAELIKNYRTMSDAQRRVYLKWRTDFNKRNPKLEHSEKRFPYVEKAINAIKSGKTPPR